MSSELERLAAGRKAIIFDFDGTLFQMDVDWIGMRQALHRRFPDAGFIRHGSFHGLNVLQNSEDRSGLAEAKAIIRKFESANTHHPLLDMVSFARSQKDAGVALGIFSANSVAVIQNTLAEHDLEDVFDVVIGRESVTYRKPDPEGLLRAIDLLLARPEEALYIADGTNEVDTAAEAGVPFFQV